MNTRRRINLEPLYTFFTEDIKPKAFARLLDELLLEHVSILVRLQLSEQENKIIHEHSNDFILYIRTLRDILPYCDMSEKEKDSIF